MNSIRVLLLLAFCSAIVYGFVPRSRSYGPTKRTYRPTKRTYRPEVVPRRTVYRRQYTNHGEVYGRGTNYQPQYRRNYNNYNRYDGGYNRRTLYSRGDRYNTRDSLRPSIRSRVDYYNNRNDYNTRVYSRDYTGYNNYRSRRVGRRSQNFGRRSYDRRRPIRRVNRFQRSRMLQQRNGNGFGGSGVYSFGPGYNGIYRSYGYDDDDDDDDDDD